MALLGVAVAFSLLYSCQKAGQSPAKTSSSAINATAFAANQSIVIAASATDTIYAVNTCEHGDLADTITFSALPDTTVKYLTANYSGYTFKRAYKVLNHSGTLQGYLVMITFNNNPVGLAFDANGLFVKVLEQREGRDLNGQGWHQGGRFGNRDNHHLDTIALSALPVAITTYFTANYPNDTLKHALINRDSSYLVVSNDNGIFVTDFTKTGSFQKRVQVYPHVKTSTTLTQSALPTSVSTYLTITYPAYVFDAAYTISLNAVLQGYIVFIDANTTKYLVRFDASGNFVKAIVVR
ncbi:MAG: PepSY-like domain-containing protein [Mucilaginibacter sp.]